MFVGASVGIFWHYQDFEISINGIGNLMPITSSNKLQDASALLGHGDDLGSLFLAIIDVLV